MVFGILKAEHGVFGFSWLAHTDKLFKKFQNNLGRQFTIYTKYLCIVFT